MTNFDDIAAKTRDWQDEQFGCTKVEATLALCEETGELARAVLKTKQNIRHDSRGNVAEEIGDVLLTVISLADRHGLSAQQCLMERFNRLKTLDFKKGNGR